MNRADDRALERQLLELSSLYEISRSLLGAMDATRIASRVVLAGMGTFGARSGALFLADDRGRYRLTYTRGAEPIEPGEALALESDVREWMLREGAFVVQRIGSPRLRERLGGRYDAEAGAAIADVSGLAGVLVMGHRLMDERYDADALSILDSIAALTSLALGAARHAERPARPAARATQSAARSSAELRRRHPALRALLGESPAFLEACEEHGLIIRDKETRPFAAGEIRQKIDLYEIVSRR